MESCIIFLESKRGVAGPACEAPLDGEAEDATWLKRGGEGFPLSKA